MLKELSICTKEALVVSGSTAFAPVVVAAAGEFSRGACAREISVRNGGSWAGVADVFSGAVDAAFIDIEFDDARNELISWPVGAFAIAFVGNRSACIGALTRAQIGDILSGSIRNWKDVGGADCAIALINRSEESGVRSLVEERVLSNLSVAQAGRYAASNREAALAVQSTPGGFSYVALPAARDLDILAFAVDDVPPSNQHVLTGMYPFWTCARVLMRREMQDFVLRFTDHIAVGSDVCDSLGYISLSRMESLNLHHVRRITR